MHATFLIYTLNVDEFYTKRFLDYSLLSWQSPTQLSGFMLDPRSMDMALLLRSTKIVEKFLQEEVWIWAVDFN